MNASEYILSKQVQWAQRSGITLIGSKGKRGRPAYTRTLAKNLFERLLPEVEKAFKERKGGQSLNNQITKFSLRYKYKLAMANEGRGRGREIHQQIRNFLSTHDYIRGVRFGV